jgi:hypothetical protein
VLPACACSGVGAGTATAALRSAPEIRMQFFASTTLLLTHPSFNEREMVVAYIVVVLIQRRPAADAGLPVSRRQPPMSRSYINVGSLLAGRYINRDPAPSTLRPAILSPSAIHPPAEDPVSYLTPV